MTPAVTDLVGLRGWQFPISFLVEFVIFTFHLNFSENFALDVKLETAFRMLLVAILLIGAHEWSSGRITLPYVMRDKTIRGDGLGNLVLTDRLSIRPLVIIGLGIT